MYYFLEIIRDSYTNKLVGATLIYDRDGRFIKYTTTNENELENIIYNYERQKGVNRNTLMYLGHIAETTNEKIKNGQYEGRYMFGYHFPNLIAFERIRRTEKYGTNINWVDRIPERIYIEKIISLPDFGNIKIKPLLLSLLVAGSIGFGVSKVNDYNSTYNEHVKTINYNNKDLYYNYGEFDDIFSKLAVNHYDEVALDELNQIIDRISEFYQPNMAGLRNEYVEGRPLYSGGCYSFASYFTENTFNNSVLKYIEDKYNSCVRRYADALKYKNSNTESIMSYYLNDLCDELYNFIYRKQAIIGDVMIDYERLSPLARLIIIEIFDNCAKTIKYEIDESKISYSRRKGYERVYHKQVLEKNIQEKNKITTDLYDKIDVNMKWFTVK